MKLIRLELALFVVLSVMGVAMSQELERSKPGPAVHPWKRVPFTRLNSPSSIPPHPKAVEAKRELDSLTGGWNIVWHVQTGLARKIWGTWTPSEQRSHVENAVEFTRRFYPLFTGVRYTDPARYSDLSVLEVERGRAGDVLVKFSQLAKCIPVYRDVIRVFVDPSGTVRSANARTHVIDLAENIPQISWDQALAFLCEHRRPSSTSAVTTESLCVFPSTPAQFGWVFVAGLNEYVVSAKTGDILEARPLVYY